MSTLKQKSVAFNIYHHKSISLPDHSCPYCKNRGTLNMIFSQLYRSNLLGKGGFNKIASVICEYCDIEIPKKEWDADLKALSKQELAQLKTPKELKKLYRNLALMFFLPIIFFALFLVYQVKFNGANSSSARKENLKEIYVNDILFVSIQHDRERGGYGLVKVISTDVEQTVIKEYSQRYKDFSDGRSIDYEDIDQNQFNSTNIIIQTQNLIKYQGLLYPNKPSAEAMYGTAVSKIEP